jgi:hypothetical protein
MQGLIFSPEGPVLQCTNRLSWFYGHTPFAGGAPDALKVTVTWRVVCPSENATLTGPGVMPVPGVRRIAPWLPFTDAVTALLPEAAK